MKRLGQQFASLVLQPVPERDPNFRRDLDRGSELSLRIVGLLEMVVPLVMMAAGVPLLPVPADVRHATAANVAFVALGALTSTVAATPAGRRWPRLFTLLSIWASVAIMLCGALWIGAPDGVDAPPGAATSCWCCLGPRRACPSVRYRDSAWAWRSTRYWWRQQY